MLDKKKFYINGQWVNPYKENNCEVINPCNEDPFAIISLGSKEDTLYLIFLSALIQALPLSKLTALSPEVPPNTTRIFLNFFLFTYYLYL